MEISASHNRRNFISCMYDSVAMLVSVNVGCVCMSMSMSMHLFVCMHAHMRVGAVNTGSL